MAKFEPGNTHHLKRKNPGRPRRLTRTIMEVIGTDKLEALIKRAFADAAKEDGPSRAWFLSQLKMVDTGQRLPAGLGRLDSFEAGVAALDRIGQLAADGAISVEHAEKSVNLIGALMAVRTSVLARNAQQLDTATLAAIEAERSAPPAVSTPLIDGTCRRIN